MRFIRTMLVAVLALGLAVVPSMVAEAAPTPGTITAVQDTSEPCGDTTGADVIVTIDNGAANTMYNAEIVGVAGNRVVTDANGDATMRLDNIGISNVTVEVAAQNHDARVLNVAIQCGTGHGKD